MAPINLLRPSCRPWTGGAISLHAVVERLRDLLPPTFEELEKVRLLAAPPHWQQLDVCGVWSCKDKTKRTETLCIFADHSVLLMLFPQHCEALW